MDNSLGEPQTMVVLGGTSDIGLAIVRELLSPAARTIVLCCRDLDAGARAADGLRSDSVSVDVRRFDATDAASHGPLLDGIVADHGDITGNTIEGTYAQASAVFSSLEALGIDLTDVFDVLETEGVDKFIASWDELLETVSSELDKAAGRA